MNNEVPRKYSLFPKTLSQIIEPLTRPVFKSQGLTNTRLLTDWTGIMGTALAQHTYPERISFPRGKKTDGMLTIAVRNGFATEVQHMQPLILERLATYLGYKAITRLSISHAYTEPAPAELKPLTPSLPASSSKISEEVEDKDLKKALESLAKTLSGQST